MNKKGFTLVELIATIAILAIITLIALTGYSSFVRKNKQRIKKYEEEQIKDTAALFFKENERKNDFKIFTDTITDTSYSCITVGKLREAGFYNDDDEFQTENLDDNTVVKIIKENEKITYEILDMNEAISACEITYNKYNINESTMNSGAIGADQELNAKINLSQSSENDSEYVLEFDITKIIDTALLHLKRANILILLDISNSMNSRGFDKAKKAAEDMAYQIIPVGADSPNVRLGVIYFGKLKDTKWVKEFNASPISPEGLMDKPDNQTNTYIIKALDMATDTLYDVANRKDINYVVVLTDGIPEPNTYNGITVNEATCKVKNFPLKNDTSICTNTNYTLDNKNATLVIIGYKIDSDSYKKLASEIQNDNCPIADAFKDEDGKMYCYYDSNSSTVNTIFENIANTIQENINNSLKIEMHLNDGIFMNNLSNTITSSLDSNTMAVNDHKNFKYVISLNNPSNTLNIPITFSWYDSEDELQSTTINIETTLTPVTETINVLNAK